MLFYKVLPNIKKQNNNIFINKKAAKLIIALAQN